MCLGGFPIWFGLMFVGSIGFDFCWLLGFLVYVVFDVAVDLWCLGLPCAVWFGCCLGVGHTGIPVGWGLYNTGFLVCCFGVGLVVWCGCFGFEWFGFGF